MVFNYNCIIYTLTGTIVTTNYSNRDYRVLQNILQLLSNLKHFCETFCENFDSKKFLGTTVGSQDPIFFPPLPPRIIHDFEKRHD